MPSSARSRATGFRTSQSRANDRTGNKYKWCLTVAPPHEFGRDYLTIAGRHDKPFPIDHLLALPSASKMSPADADGASCLWSAPGLAVKYEQAALLHRPGNRE